MISHYRVVELNEFEFKEREMQRLNSATSQGQEEIESTAPSQHAGGETGEEESQISRTRIYEEQEDHQGEVVATHDMQFVINNQVLNLPVSGKVVREVAEAGAEFILYIARNGVGEDKASNGSLVIFGSREEDFENPETKIGYATVEANRFYAKEIYIQDWRDADHIHSCFVQDGAIFVDGQTGMILADHFNLELRTEHADQRGGLGQKNASAAGMRGCLAIKTKKDSCQTDGVGKGQLVVFPGQKTPVRVDVAPPSN